MNIVFEGKNKKRVQNIFIHRHSRSEKDFYLWFDENPPPTKLKNEKFIAWWYTSKKHGIDEEILCARGYLNKYNLKYIIINYYDKNIFSNFYFLINQNNKIISFQEQNGLLDYISNKIEGE